MCSFLVLSAFLGLIHTKRLIVFDFSIRDVLIFIYFFPTILPFQCDV